MSFKAFQPDELDLIGRALRAKRKDLGLESRLTKDICGGLLIELLFITGLRGDELGRVKVRDIDFERGLMHVYSASKNSKPRVCALPPGLCVALSLATVKRGLARDEEVIRIYTVARTRRGKSEALRRYLNVLKIRSLGINAAANTPCLHGFRHSMARDLMQITGNDTSAVQQAMGHKSISSTQHYVQTHNAETAGLLLRERALFKE